MIENRRDIIKRNDLSKVIPIETPYRLGIEVSSACNFKCNFCFHSLSAEELFEKGFKSEIMSFELFKDIINQLKGFNDKIKHINLSAIGEPMVNKRLPDMIRYAKEQNVADVLAMTTNGALLNMDLCDRLLLAGIDEIVISIEGLTSEAYKKTANIDIDFEEFVSNIKYFHARKGSTKVYVKIIDTALIDDRDKQKFHDIFDSISDLAYIENTIPLFDGVNYNLLKDNYSKPLAVDQQVIDDIYVCPLIFYSMQIEPDGNVIGCCVDYCQKMVFGNTKDNNIVEIWNGKRLNDFRIQHLKKNRNHFPVCESCSHITHNTKKADVLDGHMDKLLHIFLNRQHSDKPIGKD